MKKLAAGVMGSIFGAVSASGAPIGIVALAGAPRPPAGLPLIHDALTAQPMWGLMIAVFCWSGAVLRGSRKRRAALRYA